MPENISLAKNNNLIIIDSSGSFNVVEIKLAITKVKYLHESFGIDKVLVDRRKRMELPDSGKYLEVGAYLASQTQGKIRFAILTSLDPAAHEFFKSVVTLKDGVVEFFSDEKDALRWLGF